MSNNEFCFLCISLRGSERVATLAGRKLDKISSFEPAFNSIKKWLNTKDKNEKYSSEGLLERQNATAIMDAQFSKIFIKTKINQLKNKNFQLKIGDIDNNFEALGYTASYSSANCLEGVEGDDVVVVILCKRTEEQTKLLLDKRPIHQSDAVIFLKNIGVFNDEIETTFSNKFRSGFYIISEFKLKQVTATYPIEWVNANFDEVAIANMLSVAYMFYCYLVCLRIERLLLEINANGDWDDEYRKLILVRKKLVGTRKNALIKNRAMMESLLRINILTIMPIFRLQDQLEYLVVQTDETSKVLEEQNNYLSSKRIQSIEIIIFVSTILGLAIAINAIQMAPFYDASTSNALKREIFWIVTSSVLLFGIFIWGFINQWRRTRLIIKWVNKKINFIKFWK